MSEYKPVTVQPDLLAENTYREGKRHWRVTSLIERSKDLPVFDLPLCAIYSASKVWEDSRIDNAYTLAQHVRRCRDVDITKPIILDAEGFIMDGWHRVARALADGRATIPAVRFEVTPPPDFVED